MNKARKPKSKQRRSKRLHLQNSRSPTARYGGACCCSALGLTDVTSGPMQTDRHRAHARARCPQAFAFSMSAIIMCPGRAECDRHQQFWAITSRGAFGSLPARAGLQDIGLALVSDHDRCLTASRACRIATTRFAMSGRVESSRTRFGEVAVICPNPLRRFK
jgi:hypothetical protein